ncbi:Rne/Rng family ribonuclease [Aquicoccus sp. SCR17]|nr:Rne/Rng family ribonuclease [Carideicomes alvinocaridis]
MAKKMLIDATHAEETRVVVVDGNKVEEFDFESENKRQLAGNIYLAKVTRVEPSLQAAFVDYGGNRHGFLAFSEIHPDYYQIPVADREALMEEERAYAEAQRARDEEDEKPKSRRSRSRAAKAESDDAVETAEVTPSEIGGMETIDLNEGDEEVGEPEEGSSPMERVGETPVEEPDAENGEGSARNGDETGKEAGNGAANGNGHEAEDRARDATAHDESIESVADDDAEEDIRPPRKPRPRRYKIQEVIKVRQILLVQVVKEERGNKGAALTTYLSLAGRYCVLMPNTARGGGISRKITQAADRKKLKEIAASIEVPQGAGLIIRTAGAKRTKTEIKRDYEYLQRLWEQIRELTLKSIAPAKIYEEGDLIKRSIRDLYNREIDEVFVEGERGYRIAKDFMKMIMPSHAKNVKHYADPLPLFARYQVESYLGGMFNPTVQLKSGGYIVIGVTEALVAIDVNSGRATKEGSIEETALKTNLEAADEVARQLRLRDLAGLIVIDFIDMDERKNNAAVEKRIKDKLKTDRARIQVGRISGFGLMEMSRQRLRPGMLEATTQPCTACHGTGLIRSDDSMALSILRQIEEEGTRRKSREVLVKCPVAIANFLMNQKREHIAQIELRYGMAVRIEGDATLVSPDFSIEKFKTATRSVPEATAHVISADSSMMEDLPEEDEDETPVDESDNLPAGAVEEEAPAAAQDEGEPKPKKRRRRRRRRKSSGSGNGSENGQENGQEGDSSDSEAEDDKAEPVSAEAAGEADDDDKPAPKKRSVSRSRKSDAKPAAKPEVATSEPPAEPAGDEDAVGDAPADQAAEAPAEEEAPKKKPRSRSRSRSKAKPKEEVSETPAEAEAVAEAAAETPAELPEEPQDQRTPAEPEAPGEVAVEQPAPEPEPAPAPEPEPAPQPEPVAETPAEPEKAPEPEKTPESVGANKAEEPSAKAKPKKRGWWSLGS